MAARKLQTEIDRTLKKVGEGVELFEGIYEKMQASTNQTQKEKQELDLKTQIKKLQRLRDQIKTWVASNDIKDKSQLLENRRLIETQMEKFKACEKEMKTKAFSKEGLIQAAKLDPKEQEKEEATQWLQAQVEELQMQVESTEAEVESLQGAGKKRNKAGSTAAGRLEELEQLNDRRKWHISRLEIVLRLLNNGSLPAEKVQGLKEDVQYFVESNTDEDFDEDEGIYDDLNLDEEEEKFGLAPDDDDSDDSDEASEVTYLHVQHLRNTMKRVSRADETSAQSNFCATANGNCGRGDAPSRLPNIGACVRVSAHPRNTASAAAASVYCTINTAVKFLVSVNVAGSTPFSKPNPPIEAPQQPQAQTSSNAAQSLQSQQAPPPPGPSPLPQQLQQYTVNSQASKSPLPGTSQPPPPQTIGAQRPPSTTQPQQGHTPRTTGPSAFPGSLSDLVVSFENVKQKDHVHKMLEGGQSTVPQPQDTEKPKYYVPRNPYPTAPYYPQSPHPSLGTTGIFSQLDVETLFYVFYFLPGTYQQFLAAKELKRQSWRFHVKYLTWFQRHSEPQAITEEYEQGVYVYFDWEGSWCQRKKSDFRFEYRYLSED
ncbi:uncharacterized protein LACBIDRAFT_332437 [Laccaria bicolor S238N-H82]|uniref:General negative regulator of transcription subunit n=1 Tax=Laccaria bicolor (strain S238N-H82 / ATCC MYA-4686) TaxID=486041 RepID=B0DSQ6_LACBS|nr:uncharacterized protein LACBIDRAFT_332437 [Laccaria bicolor S238N-H82]EDR02278.1 predicted protein [Laccaria bicolor S238N-H82]|eukprot:XP_001886955.1 predicted protein [Laccaria bicolor S238N-H82]